MYGIPPGLLHAQLAQESTWNPNAKSTYKFPDGTSPTGIAQFKPTTAKAMGIDPTDPVESIYGAAKYMKQLYTKNGTWSAALAHYGTTAHGDAPALDAMARQIDNGGSDAAIPQASATTPQQAPAGAFPATNISAPTPAPYNPLSPPPGAPEPAVPSLLAPNDVAPAPAAPEAGTSDIPYADSFNKGAQVGGANNEAGGFMLGGAGLLPGAPYAGAAASYVPKELGGGGLGFGGPSFGQRVAAARGVLAGSAAAMPLATLAGAAVPAIVGGLATGGAGDLGFMGTVLQGAKAGLALTAPTAALNATTGQTSIAQAVADAGMGVIGGAAGGAAGKAIASGVAASIRNVFSVLARGGTVPTAVMQKFTALTGMTGEQIQTKLAAARAQGITPTISNVLPDAQVGQAGKFNVVNQDVGAAARQAMAESATDQKALTSQNMTSNNTQSATSYWRDVDTQADKDYGALRATAVKLTDQDKDFLSGNPIVTSAVPNILQRGGLANRIDGGVISGADFDLIRKALNRADKSNRGSPDIRDAINTLSQIGDNASADFKQAGANYRLGARRADAADLGESIMDSNESVDSFKTRLDQLDAETRQQGIPSAELVKPLHDGIEQRTGTIGQSNPATMVHAFANDDTLQGKYALTYGNKAANTQRALMTAQDKANATLSAVTPRLGAEATETGSTAVLHAGMAAHAAATLDPFSAVYHGLSAGLKVKGRPFSAASQAKIAEWMHSSDPAQQQEAVTIAKGVHAYWDTTRNLVRSAGGASGASFGSMVHGGGTAPSQ